MTYLFTCRRGLLAAVLAAAVPFVGCRDYPDPARVLVPTAASANYEECPWNEQLPGEWCPDEWGEIYSAISNMWTGSARCFEMQQILLDRLATGDMFKMNDLPPDILGRVYYYPNEPWNSNGSRLLGIALNAQALYDAFWTDLDWLLRHEYGHAHANTGSESGAGVYEGRCRPPTGVDLPPPAPPLE